MKTIVPMLIFAILTLQCQTRKRSENRSAFLPKGQNDAIIPRPDPVHEIQDASKDLIESPDCELPENAEICGIARELSTNTEAVTTIVNTPPADLAAVQQLVKETSDTPSSADAIEEAPHKDAGIALIILGGLFVAGGGAASIQAFAGEISKYQKKEVAKKTGADAENPSSKTKISTKSKSTTKSKRADPEIPKASKEKLKAFAEKAGRHSGKIGLVTTLLGIGAMAYGSSLTEGPEQGLKLTEGDAVRDYIERLGSIRLP